MRAPPIAFAPRMPVRNAWLCGASRSGGHRARGDNGIRQRARMRAISGV